MNLDIVFTSEFIHDFIFYDKIKIKLIKIVNFI